MKIKVLLLMLFSCAFCFGQVKWGEWQSISCFKGIYYKVGVQKYGNKGDYEWLIKFKSGYKRKVHFSYVWTLGGNKGVSSRVTIQPNSEISSSGTARFTKNSFEQTSVNVNDVCFGETWSSCGKGRDMCYAQCEESSSSPNIPTNCNEKNNSQENTRSVSSSQNSTPQDGIVEKIHYGKKYIDVYKNGKKIESKWYDIQTGKLVGCNFYDNKEEMKEALRYYDDGKIYSHDIFKDGKVYSKYYDKQGSLTKEEESRQ